MTAGPSTRHCHLYALDEANLIFMTIRLSKSPKVKASWGKGKGERPSSACSDSGNDFSLLCKLLR